MKKMLGLFILGVLFGSMIVPNKTTEIAVPTVVVETLYVPNPHALKLSRQHNISYTLADAIYRAASRNKIALPLAIRLAKAESNLNPKATSPTGAIGLYQVLHSTARHYHPKITKKELYDPDLNSSIGLRFLRDMHRRYDGDTWRALIAYNEGPAVADTYNFDTHKYADYVLKRNGASR